jgi:hypothetical protein
MPDPLLKLLSDSSRRQAAHKTHSATGLGLVAAPQTSALVEPKLSLLRSIVAHPTRSVPQIRMSTAFLPSVDTLPRTAPGFSNLAMSNDQRHEEKLPARYNTCFLRLMCRVANVSNMANILLETFHLQTLLFNMLHQVAPKRWNNIKR